MAFEPIADEKFTPEIERELTIPKMDIPQFEGHIKEADLPDFGARDKKMLIAISVIEQKLDFFIHWNQRVNRHLRQIQADSIVARAAQTEINWRFNATKWLVVTLGAGLIAALAAALFKKLFP